MADTFLKLSISVFFVLSQVISENITDNVYSLQCTESFLRKVKNSKDNLLIVCCRG